MELYTIFESPCKPLLRLMHIKAAVSPVDMPFNEFKASSYWEGAIEAQRLKPAALKAKRTAAENKREEMSWKKIGPVPSKKRKPAESKT